MESNVSDDSNIEFDNKKSLKSKIKDLLLIGDFKKRLISTIVLIPIMVAIIFLLPFVFYLLAIAAAVIMMHEWLSIVKTAEKQLKWLIIGTCYISIPVASLIWIRSNIDVGASVTMWIFVSVWATDTAAYVFGKSLGGPKLAPSISPNKTWSGLFGGILASATIGLFSAIMFNLSHTLFFIAFGALIAILAQVGDLMESKVKRIFDVKDSGNLIPGHGGLLDRLDGMTIVAPLAAFILKTCFDYFL